MNYKLFSLRKLCGIDPWSMDRVHITGSRARFTASLNWSCPNHDLRPRFNINEWVSMAPWPTDLIVAPWPAELIVADRSSSPKLQLVHSTVHGSA
jgi:hypothetical protein